MAGKKMLQKRIKYPSKKTMNLMFREKNGNSLSRVLPVFFILVILISVFCKFAVIDRLNTVSTARKEYTGLNNELKVLQSQLVNFDEVRERYRRYSKDYLSGDERVLVDRLTILDMLAEETNGVATITSVSVTDNAVVLKVRAATLGDIATLRDRLEKTAGVVNVNVYNADTVSASATSAQYVEASVIIQVEIYEEAAE